MVISDRSSAMADPTLAPVETADFESTALPHLDAVTRFALSLTRHRDDADDLVQDTFLRAFRGWKTFRPGSDARRWLFAICRNAFLRGRQRRHPFVESDDGDVDAMPTVLTHIQAVHGGLGELFDVLDVRPAIERAIDNLPEPHHTVLVLIDLEEHSYEEAAEILEVPIGTVRSRLFRARRMIQEALIAYAEDAGVARRAPVQGKPPAPSPSRTHAMSTSINWPPDCEAVVRALWDYLDHELEAPQMAAIDAHLAECKHCRAHAEFERHLVNEITAVRRRHNDPIELRARLIDTIRRARDAEVTSATTTSHDLLSSAYDAFNARDIDSVLAVMHPDVDWPNGWEGGWVHGHDAVRAYWTRQWQAIDPHVEAVEFDTDDSGRTVVTVHQVVRDLSGNVIADGMVEHVYSIEGGSIRRMEIRESAT
jgi:RNA polymerase sigma-70 factor, ECF subfamily